MAIPRLILIESLLALGRPGLIGGLLLTASLAYGLAVVLPANHERQEARLRKAQAEAVQARAANGEAARQAPQGEREVFYGALPAQADVTRWIERIYDAARAEQLSLARGEYALAPIADTRLTRYQISLPLRGDYGQIRRFVATALATVPSLALDDLSLQRRDIGESQLEAQVRLSLYLAVP